MNPTMRIAAFFLGALFSCSTLAAAIVQSLSGSVRSGASVATASPVTVNQRILPGAVVTTSAASQAVLRFDDGQTIALGENTEFKVTTYAFVAETPAKDSFVFELLRGALRSVSGLVGRRNPQAYALRIPQATIGIRGTDFMVAVVNPAYVSVTTGSIGATNAAGSVSFAAGTTGTIASSTALAAAIPASALPASVAASFSQLGSLAIAAGVEAAVGAAVGGVTPGVVAAAAAVVAGVAAAASDNAPGTSTSTSTTASTP